MLMRIPNYSVIMRGFLYSTRYTEYSAYYTNILVTLVFSSEYLCIITQRTLLEYDVLLTNT